MTIFFIHVGSYMCTALLLNHRVVDVWLKDHKTINLVSKAWVVFDIVDLGYDASTGIFTAPSGGIYVFDQTVLAVEGQYACTSLVVNNQSQSWNHCRDKT